MARWYELKEWKPLGMIVLFILICCTCVYNFYMLYLLSSPNLLVFGDDRVRSTREQMMLMQVVLVELTYGEGITRESYVFIFIGFEISCICLLYLIFYFFVYFYCNLFIYYYLFIYFYFYFILFYFAGNQIF